MPVYLLILLLRASNVQHKQNLVIRIPQASIFLLLSTVFERVQSRILKVGFVFLVQT